MAVSRRIFRLAAYAGLLRPPYEEEIHQSRYLLDLGCDHGYTALTALQNGYAKRVLCTDVREEALSHALSHALKSGHFADVDFLLSDGLRALVLSDAELKPAERSHRDAFAAQVSKHHISPGQPVMTGAFPRPDVIVISGMGGRLMRKILGLVPTNGDQHYDESALLLKARAFFDGVRRLVISPQSEDTLPLCFLTDALGFSLIHRELFPDGGKNYPILVLEHQEQNEKERS